MTTPTPETPAELAALPCPFCGHVGLYFADGSTHRWGIASCAGCGATSGETRRSYPDDGSWRADAVKTWNTRATLAASSTAPVAEVGDLIIEVRERVMRAGHKNRDKLYPAPAAAERKPLTDEQVKLLRFLDGSGHLRGVAYGDRHPDERGNWWWRKDLRTAFPDAFDIGDPFSITAAPAGSEGE